MQIELICIGSELLQDKVNTNIVYIGEKLTSIGLQLNCAITVPDEKTKLQEIFKEVASRADIIITTGGLGPTFDDITREIISGILKKKLVFNRELMQKIARHFVDRNMEMPKDNEKQAYLIDGAIPIENKIGTAPGQIIQIQKSKLKIKNLILLPGPPSELRSMFEQTVLPYLKQKYEQKITKSKILHIHGLTESEVNQLIKSVIETGQKLENAYVSFTILAHISIVDIKITVSGLDELLVDKMLHNIKTEMCEILKENIYGEDKQTLEEVVGELLIKHKKTLSIAESCTGGLISNKITNIAGSSVYFREGIVAYSNQSKIELLSVSEETIKNFGVVSEQTALEMAHGIKKLSNSDYSIAVSGIAGPSGCTKGSTETKPIGLVCFALITPSEELTVSKKFTGGRIEIKEKSANYILDLLRRKLLKYL